MKLDNHLKEDLKKIRAFYPKETYIGGSFARDLIIPNVNSKPNDVDLFIVSDRKVEDWVFLEYLENHFDVDNTTKDYEYSKIEGQYNFIRTFGKTSRNKIDLIMIQPEEGVDAELQLKAATSTVFSSFYLKLDYSEDVISAESIKKATKVFTEIVLLDDNIIEYDMDYTTECHLIKIENYIREFNEAYNKNFILREKK